MAAEPEKPTEGGSSGGGSAWGEGMSLAWYFPIAVVFGTLLGRWIGGLLGHRAGGTWVGAIWGLASGFYEVVKVSRRMSKGGP